MKTPELLSAAQAAEILGCSIRTVHRRILSGDLPIAYQLPGETGAFVLRRDDVDRAVEQDVGRSRLNHRVTA
jgi:excisionase family DNA binding protein